MRRVDEVELCIGQARKQMRIAVLDVPATTTRDDRIAAIADVKTPTPAVFLEEALALTSRARLTCLARQVRPPEDAKTVPVDLVIDGRQVLKNPGWNHPVPSGEELLLDVL